jgi:SAM-dependent methyltransferase
MENWKNVWNRKNISSAKKYRLEELIKLSGFDSNSSRITEEDWRLMIRNYMGWIDLPPEAKDTIEVGCGPGAFYYVLKELIFDLNFTGIDYSKNFIDYLLNNYPEDNFINISADEFITAMEVDFAFSHSVFQYFIDEVYAKKVIKNMVKSLKSGGIIALLDIIDIDKFEDYIDFRASIGGGMNSSTLSAMNHLAFSKLELKLYLEQLGFKDVIILEKEFDFYKNSKFRFHIKGTKK